MSVNLTTVAADFCANLCKPEKEQCVLPTGYTGPFFCVDKSLLKRGLRAKKMCGESQMQSVTSHNFGLEIIYILMLILALLILVMTLFKLYSIYKFVGKRGIIIIVPSSIDQEHVRRAENLALKLAAVSFHNPNHEENADALNMPV